MLSDFRHAWRSLRNRPLFTTISILSLAIGIGANSAIFSFVHTILLSPMPYPDSGRLVLLEETVDGRESNGSPQRWKDWAAQKDQIESVMAYYGESMTMTNNDGSERVSAWRTFGDPLRTFNLKPLAGRDFTAHEHTGQPGAALLSHAFWMRRFGGDANVIGRALVLNNRGVTVIGVLPSSFDTEDVDALVPETVQNMNRGARFLAQVARLSPNATAPQAEQKLRLVAVQLRRQYPDTDKGLSINVVSYRDGLAIPARTPLIVLLGAVGFVLFSACLNIASLLLQRATGRRPELAMRLTLGASPWRIARLLVAEGLLLGIIGGAIGLFVALWGIDGMKLLVPAQTPRLSEVQLNWNVAGFAALLAVVTAVVCSFAPVLQNARPDLQEAFRSGSRVAGRRHWLQRTLVVAQVAISLTLLIGAGLLMRSFANMQSRPIGIRASKLIAFQSPVGWNAGDERVNRTIGSVLEGLRAIPGVDAAEYTDRLPNGGGAASGKPDIAGRNEAELATKPELNARSISHGYLAAAGVPLRKGRYLSESDSRPNTSFTVINESAARVYFGDEEPIGKRIGIKFTPYPTRFYEVVGVVGDVPMNARSARVPPMMYIDFHQQFWPIGTYVLRTPLDL
ncbi:MAG: ABC transporter permease, partial [Bryobacterales bacterium]|nr:ABC transporter permease [Bryobacterales bacterium]